MLYLQRDMFKHSYQIPFFNQNYNNWYRRRTPKEHFHMDFDTDYINYIPICNWFVCLILFQFKILYWWWSHLLINRISRLYISWSCSWRVHCLSWCDQKHCQKSKQESNYYCHKKGNSSRQSSNPAVFFKCIFWCILRDSCHCINH